MSDVAVFVLGAVSALAGLALLPFAVHLVLAGGLALRSLRGESVGSEASLPARGFEAGIPLPAEF